MIIRAAMAADAAALAAIYGHHVLHGFGTFETVPPSAPASSFAHIGNGTNIIYCDPVNDLVVVLQSGAYGYTASPQLFLSHPAPLEILV